MTDTPPPAAPQFPPPEPTPAEASAKLTELRGNKEWVGKFLSGSGPQVEEYRKLSALAADSPDKIDLAIAGKRDGDGIQTSDHVLNIEAASMLREAGMGNDVIKQVLAGGAVTQQERDAAQKVKSRLVGNADFSKRYLAGDADAKEQMMLLNIVLTSPVKEELKA